MRRAGRQRLQSGIIGVSMRNSFFALSCVLLLPLTTSAEGARVTITSQTIVAGGRSFGSTGILVRAKSHWAYATREANSRSEDRR
jgi:hypothetical protein